MAGKGDRRRESEVPEEVFVGNWERTFPAARKRQANGVVGVCVDCGGNMIERHGGRYADCESCGAENELG